MTKKEKFINEVRAAIDGLEEKTPEIYFSKDALDYWNALIATKDSEKPQFTDNGKIILQFLRDNKEVYNNIFKAKEIGEGLGISSRTASGAMRKLVTDGFIEKIGTSPVVYSLTEAGEKVEIV